MPKKPGLLTAGGMAVALLALPAVPVAAASAPPDSVTPGSADRAAGSAIQRIAWRTCPQDDPVEGSRLRGLLCGTLRVPLDYRRPSGRKITIALTMLRHTDDRGYGGAVLLNRGGPGAHGRDLPARFLKVRKGPRGKVAARYDWIGFDPRGVGAAAPAIVCAEDYQDPGEAQPDSVPKTEADDMTWPDR